MQKGQWCAVRLDRETSSETPGKSQRPSLGGSSRPIPFNTATINNINTSVSATGGPRLPTSPTIQGLGMSLTLPTLPTFSASPTSANFSFLPAPPNLGPTASPTSPAKVPSVFTNSTPLLHVTDKISGETFLVDTGAEVSHKLCYCPLVNIQHLVIERSGKFKMSGL